jgi:hypothetical protein
MDNLKILQLTNLIIRVMKSSRMRWEGHVAHWESREMHTEILVGKPEGKRLLGSPRRT